MLRVLTAQAADEAASLTPGDPHRSYVRCHPLSRGLPPEEPPPLPVRSSSALASLARRTRVVPQRRQPLRVGPGQLRDPGVNGERERAVQVRGVSLLDQLLELVAEHRGELRPLGGRLRRLAHESAHRIGATRELARSAELVE